MNDLFRPQIQKLNINVVSFFIIPLLSILIWNLPLEIEPTQQRLLGLMFWTIMWWILETLPLGVTALAATSGMVILGIDNFSNSFSSYANEVIFLFLGGFLLARAFETHQLDKRLSLFLMTRPSIAQNPKRIIIALLSSAFIFSMWLSNTATVVMLLPITLGISKHLFPDSKKSIGFLLIGLSYSASLGGMVTPVGSPPNVVAIAFLEKISNIKIGFLEWIMYAAPLAFISFIILIYFILRKIHVANHTQKLNFLDQEYRELGPLKPVEKCIMLVFSIVVIFWILPDLLPLFLGKESLITQWIQNRMPIALTSILGALMLFIFRFDKKPVLSSDSLSEVDWSTLFLFGGGLSLGTAISNTGLAKVLFSDFFNSMSGTSSLVSLLLIFSACIVFSEFASNTATANIVIPFLLTSPFATNLSPTMLAIFLALACSCGFMMPIATPPNTIVYGTKLIEQKSMIKMGLKLNLVCLFLLTFFALILKQFS